MRHETEVVITAPAELVWETLFAVDRWTEWTPTMEHLRRLDDGPLKVGSRTEVKQPGQSTAIWTVTELTAGRLFTWSTGGRWLRMTAEHHVVRRDEGTLARLTFELSGPMAGVAALLGGRKIREFVDTEGRLLKAHCERSTDAMY